MTRRKVLLPEEPAQAAARRVGDRHRFRNDASVFAAKSEIRDLAQGFGRP